MSALAPARSRDLMWRARFPVARTADRKSSEAMGNELTCKLLLVWLIGTIFLGKTFAYVSVGPLYVTEIALAVLLASNIERFRPADLLLLAATAIYVTVGFVRHGSLVFAGKDLCWLFYLFFLRFFPRNFPDHYVKIVVVCCFIKMTSLLLMPVIPIIIHKYHEAIIITFCFLYVHIKRQGRIHWPFFAFVLFISFLSDFKTFMLVILATPFLLRTAIPWERTLAPVPLFLFAVALLILVMFDYSRHLLTAAVDLLNVVAEMFRVDKRFDTGTALWRADIWTRALNHLWRDNELLFGQFPGYNFLNPSYLGSSLNDDQLTGEQAFGTVRTAHNIVVQMTMKAGIVGLVIYGYYFFKNLTVRNRITLFYVGAIFLTALTADVLEVPSRAPMFYCLLVLLIRIQAEQRGKGETPQALRKSPLRRRRRPARLRSAPGIGAFQTTSTLQSPART